MIKIINILVFFSVVTFAASCQSSQLMVERIKVQKILPGLQNEPIRMKYQVLLKDEKGEFDELIGFWYQKEKVSLDHVTVTDTKDQKILSFETSIISNSEEKPNVSMKGEALLHVLTSSGGKKYFHVKKADVIEEEDLALPSAPPGGLD